MSEKRQVAKQTHSPREKARDKKRDRRYVRTEAAIREAFLRLIAACDLEKITVTQLAREADIDRKTFYLHYNTVEEVLDSLISEEAEAIVSNIQKNISLNELLIDAKFLYFDLSSSIAPNMYDVRKMVSHVPIPEYMEKVESALIEQILSSDTAKEFGLGDSSPYLPYCITYFISGLVAVYRRWLSSESEMPLDDLAAFSSVAANEGTAGVLRLYSRKGEKDGEDSEEKASDERQQAG